MKNFLEEFKTFINRGNVMEMAVGVIVGGAFQTIVNSFVSDIMMPIITLIIGNTDFSALHYGDINYGTFITNVINFLLMAIVVFVIVKAMNKLTSVGKKEEKKD